ncbi:MAG TPA: hypothetical protein VJ785_07900 [Anaerolineales bacterium]|nr:hypothetical protein [Anaerolineales bacterium]
MARLIQAVAAYGPKIDLTKPVDPPSFMKMITRRTTLSSGVVKNVQESEVETLIDFLKEGRPVHTGIAIFTPIIDLEGNFSVSVRVDRRIISQLNIPGEFKGVINNSENIGRTSQEIAERWNADNPGDLIELETAPSVN